MYFLGLGRGGECKSRKMITWGVYIGVWSARYITIRCARHSMTAITVNEYKKPEAMTIASSV